MPRGRKPKPIAVHEQNGNPSKLNLRKAKAAVPRPPEANRSAPAWLSREARVFWLRIFPVLSEMRVMSGADEEALAQLCEHLGDTVRYTKRLKEMRRKPDGDIVTLPSGYIMMHPYVSRRAAASEKALRYLVEFGLTPSSRTRIKVSGGDEEDDLLAFVAQMRGDYRS